MVLKKIENENVPCGAFLGPWRLLGNFLLFCMFCACVEKTSKPPSARCAMDATGLIFLMFFRVALQSLWVDG